MNNPQCQFVSNYFNQQRALFFVDVGANDGITWSNSYELETELNWEGICIEPHPTIFDLLCKTRKCKCIKKAISDSNEQLDFYKIDGSWEANMLSGIIDNYDPRHKERILEEYKKFNGSLDIIKVNVCTLQEILDKDNIDHIDYLSIDTEGSEEKILKGINFDKINIELISVEILHDSTNIINMLDSYNYKFHSTVVYDSFFVKNN